MSASRASWARLMSQVDQVTTSSSIQPCLTSCHSALSPPARQGWQFISPATWEPLGSLPVQGKFTRHPLYTCQLLRSSMSPGESVICHHSNLGSMLLASDRECYLVCGVLSFVLAQGETGLGASWPQTQSYLLLHVLCISNDEEQYWPRARMCPNHEVLRGGVTRWKGV